MAITERFGRDAEPGMPGKRYTIVVVTNGAAEARLELDGKVLIRAKAPDRGKALAMLRDLNQTLVGPIIDAKAGR